MAVGFGPLSHLKKSQKCLSTNFYNYTNLNVWPPNSPDLNLMDYYVWGDVKKDTNCHASTIKAQLSEKIKAVFETLSRKSAKSLTPGSKARLRL